MVEAESAFKVMSVLVLPLFVSSLLIRFSVDLLKLLDLNSSVSSSSSSTLSSCRFKMFRLFRRLLKFVLTIIFLRTLLVSFSVSSVLVLAMRALLTLGDGDASILVLLTKILVSLLPFSSIFNVLLCDRFTFCFLFLM